MAINPGPTGWDQPWQKVVIDDDNWAAADMWFHDFDGDGFPDLIANQIFDSTVTRYWHPGANLTDPWTPEIIISGLASPSDMWLDDMNEDGLMDVCSADHTAHRGFWHENPGLGDPGPWKPNLIFRNIRLPGDFADPGSGQRWRQGLDWHLHDAGQGLHCGTGSAARPAWSPPSRCPDGFTGNISKLLVTLAGQSSGHRTAGRGTR